MSTEGNINLNEPLFRAAAGMDGPNDQFSGGWWLGREPLPDCIVIKENTTIYEIVLKFVCCPFVAVQERLLT